MKGELSTVVDRPIEEVFDFLVDIRNETAWNPRVVRLTKTSDGPIGAGTTFEGVYQGLGTLRTQLVDFERPARCSFRSTGPRMGITGTFTLTSGAGGTRIDLTADLEPQGLFRLMIPLMRPVLARQNAAAAVRLKRALEGGRDRPATPVAGREVHR